jgi:hypothetical protein
MKIPPLFNNSPHPAFCPAGHPAGIVLGFFVGGKEVGLWLPERHPLIIRFSRNISG